MPTAERYIFDASVGSIAWCNIHVMLVQYTMWYDLLPLGIVGQWMDWLIGLHGHVEFNSRMRDPTTAFHAGHASCGNDTIGPVSECRWTLQAWQMPKRSMIRI